MDALFGIAFVAVFLFGFAIGHSSGWHNMRRECLDRLKWLRDKRFQRYDDDEEESDTWA